VKQVAWCRLWRRAKKKMMMRKKIKKIFLKV